MLLIVGVLLVGCPCVGAVLLGLVGIAGPWVPAKAKYRGRQAECTANLKTLYLGERTRQRGYTSQYAELEMALERGNRYAYFLGSGPLEDRSGATASGTQESQGVGVDTSQQKDLRPITLTELPADVVKRLGVSGQCPDACDITIVCAGNIDRDSTLDVWSISSKVRVGPDGLKYEAGEPMPHVDDTAD